MEDIFNATSEDKDMGEESNEDAEEEQPVPTFEGAVADFEMVQQYLTSFPIDDSMQQPTQRESFSSSIRHVKQSRLPF
jgi:hypothetical protein